MEGISISFTPLTGARGADPSAPSSYLLEIDDFVFLLDCGWTERFDEAQLEPLRAVVDRIDAVLVSHADLGHVGGLPHAIAHLGLSAPVYATLPVCKMGQIVLYDAHQNAAQRGAPAPFALVDVEDAFKSFNELKYSQSVKLSGKGAGISISPHAAGHTLGGALWRIAKESEEVVYAPACNHQKEGHLAAGTLQSFHRPSLLVASARTALIALDGRRERERELLKLVEEALRGGGDVLVPVDAAGRVLELLLLLEHHWRSTRALHAHPIVLLHRAAEATLEAAKSQIEWMSEEVVTAFDSKRENSFALRHVRPCASLADCAKIQGPKVVLTTSALLDCGFASQMLPATLAQPKALLLLTQRAAPPTAASVLGAWPTPPNAKLTLYERQELAGAELAEFEEAEKRRAAAAAAAAALDADDDEEEDGEGEGEGEGGDDGDVTMGDASAAGEPMETDEASLYGGAAAAAPAPAASAAAAEKAAAELAAVKKLKVAELKAALQARGLADDGKKDVLAARLEAAIKKEADDASAATPTPARQASAASASSAAAAAAGAGSGASPRMVGRHAPAAKKQLLLPYEESLPARDEWGAVVTDAEWKMLAAAGDTAGPSAGGFGADTRRRPSSTARRVDKPADAMDDDDDDGDDFAAASRRPLQLAQLDVAPRSESGAPCKWVGRVATLAVKCAVRFVDMEGLSDGRSTKTILRDVAPRRLVLIGADDAATAHLAEYCEGDAALPHVATPAVGVSVDATSDTNVYKLKLSDELFTSLTPLRLGEYEIARLDGVLRLAAAPGDADAAATDAAADAPMDAAADAAPAADGAVVEAAPAALAAAPRPQLRKGLAGVLELPAAGAPRGGLHFISRGELRLADFKQLLGRERGLTAEIAGGSLVVNKAVVVRKVAGESRLVVEGAYGDDYLRVRDLLYAQYTVV